MSDKSQSSDVLAAAVVGLGRIGSLFDAEPGRKTVWTHAGAYLALPARYRLVAACETDPANRAAFRVRCPDVPVYDTPEAMVAAAKPDVVSICTPAPSHASVLERVLIAGAPRAIWCEKPLADDLESAAQMVRRAREANTTLVVSFVRRWYPIWRAARDAVAAGAVGNVVCVRAALPNRLLSIGSHAVDLISFLGGKIETTRPFPIPALAQEGEPAVAAFFRLAGGAYGLHQVTGRKHEYLVEVEIVGSDGRMIVREDTGTLTVERFETSPRYDGYREPGAPQVTRIDASEGFSPFVAIAEEIAELLAGARAAPGCDGAAALEIQTALQTMVEAAARGD